MERKLIGRKTLLYFALSFLAAFSFRSGVCVAAGSEPAGTVRQIETVVIHVDQYAVYAPKLIFYFDTRMEKQKIASMTKAANQLRNKKAIITYSSAGEAGRDNRSLLLDIVSATAAPGAETPPRDTPSPTGDERGKQAKMLANKDVTPKDNAPAGQQVPARQPVSQDKTQPRTAGQSTAITREEVSAFVRHLLELNERKDLSAATLFYADKVDYYDRGVVDRDYVRRDLLYYFRNWEKINTSLDGDVVMIVLDPDVRTAKFISTFSVKNQKKALAGKTENIWKIQRINGQLKLVDVKQKIISREPSGL